MYISSTHLIIALIFGALVFLFLKCRDWAKVMNDDEEPDDLKAWTVGDFKKRLKDLPDDMPVILMDISTDDVESCNYVFRNENVDIDDYYIFESEEYDRGEPSGKALFLYFDNMLNDDPINNYFEPINPN